MMSLIAELLFKSRTNQGAVISYYCFDSNLIKLILDLDVIKNWMKCVFRIDKAVKIVS